jgi:hypothetical protein
MGDEWAGLTTHHSSFIIFFLRSRLMTRTVAAATVLLVLSHAAAADKLTVKVADQEPPKELADAVRAVLAGKAMTVTDDAGKVVCTVWAAKELEAKATADEVKAGPKYAHVEETTVVGAVQFPAEWRDYRKQKVKAGVYTLRLGIQPMDGDHQGTAPFNDFCLLCPAGMDKAPDLLEVKAMHELSAKSTGRKHPAMMLLFPNKKPADAPAVEAKPKDHWLLNYGVPVGAGGEKAVLGFGLVVAGVTEAE